MEQSVQIQTPAEILLLQPEPTQSAEKHSLN